MSNPNFSFVRETGTASPEEARMHFATKLTFETDAWDLKTDLERGRADLVVIDVRSPEAFDEQHIAGAINLPHRSMTAETTAQLPKDKLMVTYCWGPGCNGSTKGALRLAALGFRVKELIGGIEYWIREGGNVQRKANREEDRADHIRSVV